jgi:hypothetical protein
MAKRVIRVRITRDSRDNNGDNQGIIKIMKNGDYPVYSARIGPITRTPHPLPASSSSSSWSKSICTSSHYTPPYYHILRKSPYTTHQIIHPYPPRPSMNSIGLNLDTPLISHSMAEVLPRFLHMKHLTLYTNVVVSNA